MSTSDNHTEPWELEDSEPATEPVSIRESAVSAIFTFAVFIASVSALIFL